MDGSPPVRRTETAHEPPTGRTCQPAGPPGEDAGGAARPRGALTSRPGHWAPAGVGGEASRTPRDPGSALPPSDTAPAPGAGVRVLPVTALCQSLEKVLSGERLANPDVQRHFSLVTMCLQLLFACPTEILFFISHTEK